MTGAISTLRCPNCGAPAAPEAARCEYCRSRLATVSCPKCFGVLFAGATFCPHCGVPSSRAEAAAPAQIRCPACRAAMRWVQVGTIDLLECAECDGTWIEAVTFERLCADRESQAAALHTNPSQPKPGNAVRIDRIRYRPCLKCGKLMNRINFALVSGAVLDVCRGHGTFLDRGELHQVIQFILDGGLERTREARRQELVEEEHRLRDLERGKTRITPGQSTSESADKSLHEFLSVLLDRSR